MAKLEGEITVKIDVTEVERLIDELKTSSPAFSEDRIRALIREEIEAHEKRQIAALRAQGLPCFEVK